MTDFCKGPANMGFPSCDDCVFAEPCKAMTQRIEELSRRLKKSHDFIENHEPQGRDGWKHREFRTTIMRGVDLVE